MKRSTQTTETYKALGSSKWSKQKRAAFVANAAAGITALVTGGIIVPVHQVVGGSARRLIGVRGIASDAAHFDFDANRAIDKATREFIALRPASRS